jgi:hypothetical protein
MISDGYAEWYANRLWNLLPPIYRTMDAGPSPNAPGPLRELCNRIGAQAAVVRRSIDRMGENQSIETCDDWVIPYIGDLVATRLVSCLDAAAQRIDVAKTIYYRRRAGTVGVLEELTADIASRDARVVEFFRRLGRTRHQFDPPLSYQIESKLTGPVGFTGSKLEVMEGLFGAYSNTPAGGFADLRNAYAATNTGSAFDEYAYTADLRAGGQTLGHFNIHNLGVFIWWQQAFPITAATPVGNKAATCFTFDPTGREIPLFAYSQRIGEAKSWGEHWVSPDEWMLSVPIREILWKTLLPQPPAAANGLYSALFAPQSLSVGLMAGGTGAPIPLSQLSIHPDRGLFSFTSEAPAASASVAVSYNFGLLSEIGAGGFDNGILSEISLPSTTVRVSGGNQALPSLDSVLSGISQDVVIQINDSLTYAGPTTSLSVPNGTTVAICAESKQRPVFRWYPGGATWTITGNASSSVSPTVLVLEGILLQGANIVLQGNFDSVYLRMMTLDPGDSSPALLTAANTFASAIDGMPLSPTSLLIEGEVTNLYLERCIVGPIRTANGGVIQQMTATDSIIQSIPTHLVPTTGTLNNPNVFDWVSLATSLKSESNSLASKAVSGSTALQDSLKPYQPEDFPSSSLQNEILAAIEQFTPADAEAAWPLALADLALGFSEGTVSLSRCTVLGQTYTHRLSVSESILDSLATVEDAQDGCVRFSAFAAGSNLHQPYRSVQVPPNAPIFVSHSFGQPGYAQLLGDADAWILDPGQASNACNCGDGDAALKPGTILEGAQNGSEMGVFCLEAIPLKRRGLALKFEEYSPIGQLPVWIDAD